MAGLGARTPVGVRTSSRSASPAATAAEGRAGKYDRSLNYPSPFRRGEPFDLDKAIEAAADCLDDDSEVFAPRERIVEVLEKFIDDYGEEPWSWSWFAKPSGEDISQIDRARIYLQSGNMEA